MLYIKNKREKMNTSDGEVIKPSFAKAFLGLFSKTFVPSVLMAALAFWMFWVATVATKSNSGWLTFISIFLFIAVALIIFFLTSFMCGAILDITFSSPEKTYTITQIDKDTFLVEENKPSNGFAGTLLLNFFLSLLIAAFGILFFVIGLIRIICSESSKIAYCAVYSELISSFKKHKKGTIIAVTVSIVILLGCSIATANIQNQNNINIFEDFQPEPEPTYIQPTLHATEFSMTKGGYYIDGYLAQLVINISYNGEASISSMDGTITIYNKNGSLLLTSDTSFSNIKNGNYSLDISCRNTSQTQELSLYSLSDITIYFQYNTILYNGFTVKNYSNIEQIN